MHWKFSTPGSGNVLISKKEERKVKEMKIELVFICRAHTTLLTICIYYLNNYPHIVYTTIYVDRYILYMRRLKLRHTHCGTNAAALAWPQQDNARSETNASSMCPSCLASQWMPWSRLCSGNIIASVVSL